MEHVPPLLSIVGYLAYPKQFRIHSALLQSFSVFHNGVLIVFSAWTFVSLSLFLHREGIVFRSNYYFQSSEFDRIAYWFYISKYYEFFDTFLLYLNGKTPLFLQKYHHVGALLGWHALYVYKVDCIWISTFVNSFVHTIMYTYYLGCLLKFNQVRVIKKYITSLQLIQLSVPTVLGLYFYAPTETPFKYGVICVFTLYVAGLIVLFSQFYYSNYLKIANYNHSV